MTPLQRIADLVAVRGTPAQIKLVRSLAAREDLRVDDFWEDLGAPALWDAGDSVAALADAEWDDPAQADALRTALRLVAEDLQLRGFDSTSSSAWLERQS